jgi:hypothetical protein
MRLPGRFAGKRFDLGGDELTGNDAIRQQMGDDVVKMYE